MKKLFGKKKKKQITAKKRYTEVRKCRFCKMTMKGIDYKDILNLQKLTSGQGKLFSRKRSGNCATHQRFAKIAIKRARFMALMPYVG
ncbi:MAG TPA: 30S ribosomal protein S18 [Candidatus Brocadiia bacterium]|nr:30S ribosomal protein S18 [Planctomycetota bacterium]MBI4007438.1 30S ribosomal protein S18 [Planctomycetota bacterium]MDO8092136.1 30S ribosomal protein S18 [Candidatus Brocadiales bacterium]